MLGKHIFKGLQAAIEHERARSLDGEFLHRFIAESNRIEGINRRATQDELTAHAVAVACEPLGVRDLEKFVGAIQPDAALRRQDGVNVRVGDHVAPPGGPNIEHALVDLLRRARKANADPWRIHVEYETLHPFTDGNGRSGRALWLWMMVRQNKPQYQLGFLHAFYYQTLEKRGGS